MGRLDALDLLHDLIGCGIDRMDAVAGAVGDIDQGGTGPGGCRCKGEHYRRMSQDAQSGMHGEAPILAALARPSPSKLLAETGLSGCDEVEVRPRRRPTSSQSDTAGLRTL